MTGLVLPNSYPKDIPMRFPTTRTRTHTHTLRLALVAGFAFCTPAFAVLTMDYVSVGHAGNAADPATGSLYGAVAYAYQIGKYEVTNTQYGEFLNAVDPGGTNANGVYNASMGSDARGGITYTALAASGAKYTISTSMGDKPVNYVSWYDGARFTNWMHNGQGNGSTGIILKNVGATVYLPSEDEWYKAAYYDPTAGAGGGDNYWEYATQSNTAPTVGTANATGVISNPGANVANFNNGAVWNGATGNVTTVGSAGAGNYFGTADQAGNVFEWNDAVIGSSRGLRGGSWNDTSYYLAASNRFDTSPTIEHSSVGFRVASVPVPEPSAFLVSMLLVSAFLTRRRRTTL
jgi:formylglycine-generating enzyme required for sulfatase activity